MQGGRTSQNHQVHDISPDSSDTGVPTQQLAKNLQDEGGGGGAGLELPKNPRCSCQQDKCTCTCSGKDSIFTGLQPMDFTPEIVLQYQGSKQKHGKHAGSTSDTEHSSQPVAAEAREAYVASQRCGSGGDCMDLSIKAQSADYIPSPPKQSTTKGEGLCSREERDLSAAARDVQPVDVSESMELNSDSGELTAFRDHLLVLCQPPNCQQSVFIASPNNCCRPQFWPTISLFSAFLLSVLPALTF